MATPAVTKNTFFNYGSLPKRFYISLFALFKRVKQEQQERSLITSSDLDWTLLNDPTILSEKIKEVGKYTIFKEIEQCFVAKTFLTDVNRSSDPDRFTINGEVMPPKMEPEEIVKWLKKHVSDKDNLKIWSQVWNYGLKILVTNEIREQFQGIDPRLEFTESNLNLDTEQCRITCRLQGIVPKGTDLETFDAVFFPVPKKFTGLLVVDLVKGTFDLETTID